MLAQRLAVAGFAFSAFAVLAPALPYRTWEWVLDAPGPLLLVAAFVVASRGRPRASWLAGLGLLALLALPVVPYEERTCSDVPKPYTMDFCDEGPTHVHPFGATVVLGRAFGYGDLGSVTWRAPWWATLLALAWLAAFAALAARWKMLPKALRGP